MTQGAPTDGHARLSRLIDSDLREHTKWPLAELSDGVLTRDQVLQETDRLVVGFQATGLRPGDRIAFFVRDERQLILLVVAALRAGIAFVVGDSKVTADEALRLVTVCRPAAVLADAGTRAEGALAQLPSNLRVIDAKVQAGEMVPVPCASDGAENTSGTAMLIYTSGTTSSAKAVELTYDNLLAQLDIFAEVYGFGCGDRLLNLLPPHHTDGLTRGPLAALRFGATLCRPMAFSVQAVPELLERVSTDRITHLIAVPAMLRIFDQLGRHRPDAFRTPHFRFVLSSADILDVALWSRFQDCFGVPVVNAYGLSEAACDALFAGPDDESRAVGTIGRPIGVQAQVIDEHGQPLPVGAIGELVLSGPTVMRGYLNAPELTAEVLTDGRLHTGDLVRINSKGLFEFVGRRKTAIVSAGVTIYPEGVTAVLSTMPDVAEAFALGRPDPERNERLVAVVVPALGTTLTIQQVWTFCRDRLPPEQMPVEFVILNKLPRGPSGKVMVADLTAALTQLTPATPQLAMSVYEVAARCLRLLPETLSPNSNPFNTPGWDSLAHLTLITEIEEAFGILFSATDIVEFGSLKDAEAIVARALESDSAAQDRHGRANLTEANLEPG